MPPPPIDRIASGVHESLGKRLRHVLKISEVGVITFAFPCQKRVQRMMEIIVPLRVESVSSKLRWTDDTRIVRRTFGDDIDAAIERRPLFMDGLGKLFEEIQSGVIENGMDRIEAKR